MVPVYTSLEIIARIEKLNKEKKKELSYIKLIRMFRKTKVKEINEKLQINWERLYEFYPDLCNIKNVSTFSDLINSGFLQNKIRLSLVGEKSYVAGSKEWSDYLDEQNNKPDPFEKLIGGPV